MKLKRIIGATYDCEFIVAETTDGTFVWFTDNKVRIDDNWIKLIYRQYDPAQFVTGKNLPDFAEEYVRKLWSKVKHKKDYIRENEYAKKSIENLNPQIVQMQNQCYEDCRDNEFDIETARKTIASFTL